MAQTRDDGNDSSLDATAAGQPTDGPTLAEGTVFAGRYQVIAQIGRGGMGTVYKVRDTHVAETVALKVLDLGPAPTELALERFRREVRLARRVTHRNIARTHDLGEEKGTYFLTMELVEGQSLQGLLDQKNRLDAATVARIGEQVARALAAAHAAGVVHRDLKPANVLLAPDGRVVLTDFGVARAAADDGSNLKTGGPIGTPLYMAPEQVVGKKADARTDLYALGLMLNEMLTGIRAFEEETAIATALARLHQPPPDPRHHVAVPDVLADVIVQCLAVDPAQRPASADVVGDVLSSVLAGAAGDSTSSGTRTSVSVTHPRTLAAPGTPSGRPTTPRSLYAPISPGDRTLAVLPFRYRGPAEHDYLGDAMAEELIDVLSRTKGLRVLSSGATQKFKTDRDPRTLGDELNVDVVVDGTIQRSGETCRIAARLVDVSNGVQLWSDRFDTSIGDVFAMQERMSRRIAEALRLSITTHSYGASAPPEAIELYLRGRREMQSFRLTSRLGAVDQLEKCLELAPDFKPAIAAHALVSLRSWFVPTPEVARDWEMVAKQSVARALERASELPETHLAAAMLAAQHGDYGEAARACVRALDIAPTLAGAHDYLGNLQCEAGRVAEGMKRLELAAELDPTLVSPRTTMARVFALQGRTDDYERMLAGAKETEGGSDPTVTLQLELRVAAWHGDIDRFVRTVDLLVSRRGAGAPLLDAYRNYVIGRMTPEEIAPRLTTFARTTNPRFQALFAQLATEAHCKRGQTALALEALGRGAENVLVDVLWMDKCPPLELIRDLPEFADSRAKVKARADMIWAH